VATLPRHSYPLSFYYGFAGVFTSSTAKYDSGTAFITYAGKDPVDILFITSKASGPEIKLEKDLSIRKIVGQVVLGETNVQKVYQTLGNPTALGIKSFKGDPSMFLSNWSYSKIEIKGTEDNFVPVGPSGEQKMEVEQAPSYMVLDIAQSRLMVGHDQEGIIKEIIWLKPFRP
jgi:hypothetical protein